MADDFRAKLERLKQQANVATTAESTAKKTAQKLREKKKALFGVEREEELSTDLDVTQTEIYQILNEEELTPEQQAEQIVEKLVFNFEDIENESQFAALQEVRTIIAALIEDFTERSIEAIEITRDSPLSKLTDNIREVFENYAQLQNQRADLKDRLDRIQKILGEDGNEAAFLGALQDAQSKKDEKERLEKEISDANGLLSGANDELKGFMSRENQLDREVQELAESKWWIQKKFGTEYSTKVQAAEKEKSEIAPKKAKAKRTVEKAKEKASNAQSSLAEFLSQNDFAAYEEILEILDIGDPEFKEKLKLIADKTLQYIKDTETTMVGVRDQLVELLGRVKGSVHTSQNTTEKITILLNALNEAQNKNAEGYEEFKNKQSSSNVPEGLESVSEMDQKKIENRATEFTSAMTKSVASTTDISANVKVHETTLIQMRTDLEAGVNSAERQLLQAVSTSAIQGQTMLQRTERLAAMAQQTISGSMFSEDFREAVGDVKNDFVAQVQEQMRENSNVQGLTTMVGELSEALEGKNDISIDLAAENAQLVERLAGHIEKLSKANEAAMETETVIAVSEMHRRAANDDAPAHTAKTGTGPEPNV